MRKSATASPSQLRHRNAIDVIANLLIAPAMPAALTQYIRFREHGSPLKNSPKRRSAAILRPVTAYFERARHRYAIRDRAMSDFFNRQYNCPASAASMLFYRICARSAFHNEVSTFDMAEGDSE